MDPMFWNPSPLFYIHYTYICVNVPLHYFFSYSLSFLYFSSLNFFSLSTLFYIGCSIFGYNELHLKILKMKLDIVPLALKKKKRKKIWSLLLFSQLIVVSSVHKCTNGIESCCKYIGNDLVCSKFENILFWLIEIDWLMYKIIFFDMI